MPRRRTERGFMRGSRSRIVQGGEREGRRRPFRPSMPGMPDAGMQWGRRARLCRFRCRQRAVDMDISDSLDTRGFRGVRLMYGKLSADGRDLLCSRIPADMPEAAAGFPKPQLFALRRLSPGGFPLQGFVSIRRLSRDAGVVVWNQEEYRDGIQTR